jgi:hypothetical protein
MKDKCERCANLQKEIARLRLRLKELEQERMNRRKESGARI